jgi:hypothetical protein
MMRKLFLIFLVSAAVSNAAVLELSVNGITNGTETDQAISLAPSGTLMIGVHCTADADYTSWFLGGLGPGSLAGIGTIYSPPAPDAVMYDYSTYDPGPSEFAFLFFYITGSTAVDPAIGKWWDEQLTYEGEGTVTIELLDGAALNLLDTLQLRNYLSRRRLPFLFSAVW